ncbi:MAG: hypothetical protein U5O69_07480 [Candidatus Competibacteraceae bacterium]|nr:hypothetical protein [Candidatus Competibacteraceae bacterium]
MNGRTRNRATGGVGIARPHSGELTLRNHLNGGLEAVLELPR